MQAEQSILRVCRPQIYKVTDVLYTVLISRLPIFFLQTSFSSTLILVMASRITQEFVRRLNVVATGSAAVVVKPNELESAIMRPAWTAHYNPSSPDHVLAAELAYGIIQNHPFVDGNKRTAFLAANEFLREKGHRSFTNAEPAAAISAMSAIDNSHSLVAQGQMSVEQLAQAYAKVLGVCESLQRSHTRRLPADEPFRVLLTLAAYALLVPVPVPVLSLLYCRPRSCYSKSRPL